LKKRWLADMKQRHLSDGRIQAATRALDHLIALVGSKKLVQELSKADLIEFRDKRLADKLHPRTVNLQLHLIRTCLRAADSYFDDLKWTPPTCKLIPVPRRARERVWSQAERNAIIKELERPHWNDVTVEHRLMTRDAILLALSSSMRIIEIVRL